MGRVGEKVVWVASRGTGKKPNCIRGQSAETKGTGSDKMDRKRLAKRWVEKR